jgi:hypothetical protein
VRADEQAGARPGATVRILEVGELVHVYLGDELIRAFAPDRSKRYRPLSSRPWRRTLARPATRFTIRQMYDVWSGPPFRVETSGSR